MTIGSILAEVMCSSPHALRIAEGHIETFFALINEIRGNTPGAVIHFFDVGIIIPAILMVDVFDLGLVDPPELLVLDSFNLEDFRIGHCRLEIRLNFLPLM